MLGVSHFLPHWTGELALQLDWGPTSPKRSPGSSFTTSRVMCVYTMIRDWALRSRTKPSILHSKCYHPLSGSPTLNLGF